MRDLIDHVEFDTIYHEHYCYFSCSAVDALMRRHGLHLNDVEYFPRPARRHAAVAHRQAARPDRALPAVPRRRGGERHDGRRTTTPASPTGSTPARTRCGRSSTTSRRRGRTVAAYGAAAKGATLLNSTGISTDRVAYVVDRNVHKQGLLMPGCRLPIRPVEVLLDDRPDDLLLLAWNFADEIIGQQREYAARRRHVLRAGPDAESGRRLTPRRSPRRGRCRPGLLQPSSPAPAARARGASWTARRCGAERKITSVFLRRSEQRCWW